MGRAHGVGSHGQQTPNNSGGTTSVNSNEKTHDGQSDCVQHILFIRLVDGMWIVGGRPAKANVAAEAPPPISNTQRHFAVVESPTQRTIWPSLPT
jgi:hypothetical protein